MMNVNIFAHILQLTQSLKTWYWQNITYKSFYFILFPYKYMLKIYIANNVTNLKYEPMK